MKKILLPLLALVCLAAAPKAQVLINEIQTANATTLQDEDGDYGDWFELFNAGTEVVNLDGYSLSDKLDNPGKWPCPPIVLQPGQHKLIHASGKNRVGDISAIHHFEAPVYPWNQWRYIVPIVEQPASWRNIGFDASAWAQGPGGFGFGDDDDGTVIPSPATSVFSRTTFNLTDPSAAIFMVVAADYDDAFVCYLNGTEIARANIGTPGVPPAFNAFAAGQHEANGYQGGDWDVFEIPYETIQSLLVVGENVVAMQAHNVDAFSSDLTGNLMMVIGMSTIPVQTELTEEWLGITVEQTHTNFGLRTGETLLLADSQGQIVDSKEITPTQADHVIRRATDGDANWCVSPEATPGESNTGQCFDGYNEPVVFSTPSGVYPAALYIELSHPDPNVQIRVTGDGSVPNENSPLYNGPFSAMGSTVLSARAFSADKLPSLVKKNTYLINESDIGLPIVSVSTNPDNLWDPVTGIHVMGPNGWTSGYPYFNANFWQDWEREAYIEYFDGDHVKQIEGPVGIKINGGWSRAREQKSFRLQAKSKFGMESMDYPMIPDKAHITSFKGINLRTGGNDYDNYRFHDAMLQRAMRNTEADYMAYSPAIVFLNGEYWGFMEIRENLDQHFPKGNYDISADDVTVISHNYMGFNIISGTQDAFNELHSFATQNDPNGPDFFVGMDERVDLESMADYTIGQVYYSNGDWGNGWNNTKYWKDDRPGGKWRYMLMDLDFGMGLASGPNDNQFPSAFNGGTMEGQIFSAFIQNNQYRTYFINRFADLINTIYQPANMQAIGYSMRDEIEPIFLRHTQRWNTNFGSLNNVLNDRLNWNVQRIPNIRNIIQSQFNLPGQVDITLDVQPAGAGRIHISTIEPSDDEYPWSGVYFNGVPVKLTAIPNPGYTFNNWSANNAIPGGSISQTLELTFTTALNFTANFNGSAVANPISITELMFNPDGQINSGDWIEIRNNMSVPLNTSDWKLKDANYFNVFEFGFNSTLAANTTYILAEDVALFQAAYPNVQNVLGPMNFGFNNDTDQVTLYKQDDQPYIQFGYSDTDHPDLACSDGCGHSRGHSGTGTDYNFDNWYLECENGSPGVPFTPCDYDLAVTEINYQSPLTANAGDWFEVRNFSGQTINLSGWVLRDQAANMFTLPSGTTLDAGDYLVIAQDPSLFQAQQPNVQNFVGPSNVALSNNSDAIKLYDPTGKLHYAVRYFDETPWPAEPAGLGRTLEFIEGSAYQCHADSWFIGCPGGSPGVAFDPTCPPIVSVFETPQSSAQVLVWPNPSSGIINVSVGADQLAAVRVFDMMGRQVWETGNVGSSLATADLTLLKAGVYLLVAQTNNGGHSVHRIIKE